MHSLVDLIFFLNFNQERGKLQSSRYANKRCSFIYFKSKQPFVHFQHPYFPNRPIALSETLNNFKLFSFLVGFLFFPRVHVYTHRMSYTNMRVAAATAQHSPTAHCTSVRPTQFLTSLDYLCYYVITYQLHIYRVSYYVTQARKCWIVLSRFSLI